MFENRGLRMMRDCATGPSSEDVASEEEDSASEEDLADGEVGGRVLFVGRWSIAGAGRGEVC